MFVRSCRDVVMPMSGVGFGRGTPTGTDWLTKRSSNHAPALLALLRRHENWVEPLGCDDRISERIKIWAGR